MRFFSGNLFLNVNNFSYFIDEHIIHILIDEDTDIKVTVGVRITT